MHPESSLTRAAFEVKELKYWVSPIDWKKHVESASTTLSRRAQMKFQPYTHNNVIFNIDEEMWQNTFALQPMRTVRINRNVCLKDRRRYNRFHPKIQCGGKTHHSKKYSYSFLYLIFKNHSLTYRPCVGKNVKGFTSNLHVLFNSRHWRAMAEEGSSFHPECGRYLHFYLRKEKQSNAFTAYKADGKYGSS